MDDQRPNPSGVTNPESGSTVPPMPMNRRYQRGKAKRSKKAEPEQQIDPAAALHQMRALVFHQASETLAILRAIQEEGGALEPVSSEISESLGLVRKAFIQTGLELVRPAVAQLRELTRIPDLKILKAPADVPLDDAPQNP